MEQAAKTTQKTIMVVDDDPSVLSFLTFSLESEGFKVVSAHDAETALKRLESTVPHLILLDLMLPRMDGFAMCKKLRSNASTKSVPVLFITAYAGADSLKKTSEVGAQGLIEKPIMFDGLLLQIYDALQGRFSVPSRIKFAP